MRETATQREGPMQREISESFFFGLSGSRLCPYRSSSNLQGGELERGEGGDSIRAVAPPPLGTLFRTFLVAKIELEKRYEN